MIHSASFEHDLRSAKQARRFVTDQLQGHDPTVVDDVVLMASELVTNAIQHATTAFTLTLEVEARTIRVAVSDGGPGMPSVKNPRPEEPNGRGLQLVAKLADEWGVGPNCDGGNTVWFSLDVEPSLGRRRANEEADSGRRAAPQLPVPDVRPGKARRRSPDHQPPGPRSAWQGNGVGEGHRGASCRTLRRRSSRHSRAGVGTGVAG